MLTCWIKNRAPVGDWAVAQAVVVPGLPTRDRCSGLARLAVALCWIVSGGSATEAGIQDEDHIDKGW